eukprot:scaffold65103_cov80-Phaeocystis_antarctica.AAC.1
MAVTHDLTNRCGGIVHGRRSEVGRTRVRIVCCEKRGCESCTDACGDARAGLEVVLSIFTALRVSRLRRNEASPSHPAPSSVEVP